MALQLFRSYLIRNCNFYKSSSVWSRRIDKVFGNTTNLERTIMSSSYNFDKIEEELEKNPYYQKYASKIEALKKSNPEEFNSRLKEFEDKKKPKSEKKVRRNSLTKLTKPQNLSEIMKMDLIQDKNSEEICEIWHGFHKGKDCVANVLSRDVFNIIQNRGDQFPTFIHPVPKDKGYEFYMSFFEDNTAHFTPLRKYKELQENSPECLEIHYYTELVDSKEIVLIRGTYDTDELTNLEANCLASSLQLYYSEIEGKRANLLESFSKNPDSFQHMDLIADFEACSKPKGLD